MAAALSFDFKILYRLYRYGYRHYVGFPTQDRSKGKFRPFILYASFPVTLLAITNFVAAPFDVTGKTVMATILFMLYGLFFSMMNCSYGAMVPAITKSPNERASLAAWRQGGATLGLLLCTVGFVPGMNLIEGNQQLGYIFAATLFSTVRPAV
ncbi:MFS transporter [Escherichia coli]|nr:MFS transporter [Escherichia coli]